MIVGLTNHVFVFLTRTFISPTLQKGLFSLACDFTARSHGKALTFPTPDGHLWLKQLIVCFQTRVCLVSVFALSATEQASDCTQGNGNRTLLEGPRRQTDKSETNLKKGFREGFL